MATLSTLPSELLLGIISHLPALSQHHLSSTSRRFYQLIGPARSLSATLTERYSILLSISEQDDQRLFRVCSECIQLKPFYHFSLKQASGRRKAKTRRCLQCLSSECHWLFGSPLELCEECGDLGFFAESHDPDIECPVHRGCCVFTVIRALDERMRGDREELARLKELQGVDKGGFKALEKYLREVVGVQINVGGLFPGLVV